MILINKIQKQCLVLPINKAYIAAGWKHPAYYNYWHYNHLGWDLVTSNPSTNDNILASGVGKVITAGRDSRVGNVLAIQYYNVFNRKTNKIQDVIARYMHMSSLSVKPGQDVTVGTILGKMGGTGIKEDSYGIHLHIEFDTDTKYPNNSGQVKGGTIFKAGNSNSMVNPIELFHCGANQSLNSCENAMCYPSDLNLPKAFSTVFIANTSSAVNTSAVNGDCQKLILPVNNATVTAGYKNTKYQNKFGFRHFGLDIIGQRTVYASGNGTVMACGKDSILGNVIAIVYPNIYNHKTGKTQNVVVRYNHLSAINVRKGQKVNKDTVLGVMGNTGKYSQGIHLHIEVDTDAREQYACYTPTLSGNGTIMKAGQDSTINPAEILHVKTSKPDKQSIKRLFDGYSSNADIDMPKIQ